MHGGAAGSSLRVNSFPGLAREKKCKISQVGGQLQIGQVFIFFKIYTLQLGKYNNIII